MFSSRRRTIGLTGSPGATPPAAHPFARRTAATLSAVALAMTGIGTAHAADGSKAAAAATASATSSPTAAQSTALTESAAQAQAHKSGKAVPIPSAETSTSTLTAEPDGMFSLSTYAQPIRKKVGGTWEDLNPKLRKNADGTISPTLADQPLSLSGGGSAALATMHSGAESMAITLPTSLPAPTLSGNQATYSNVAPGVDLVVTVTAQGGFSDVYVVHNAAAAASPALAKLLTDTIKTSGVTVSTDSQGNLFAQDANGSTAFSSPAPTFWDSATGATSGTTTNTGTNAGTNAATKSDAARSRTNAQADPSTVLAPGANAHHGSLAVHLSKNALTLTPDATVLNNPDMTYPVIIDPSWSQGGGKSPTGNPNAGWATVSSSYPSSPEWNSSAESQGELQVGESSSGFWADSLINFELPLNELGSEGTSDQISGATLYLTGNASTNCNAQTVDVYAPTATLKDGVNNNWNSWFTSSRSLGSAIGSTSVPGDWASGACTTASKNGFALSTTWIQSDLTANKSLQTLALAGSSYSAEEYNGSGSGQNDYELFDEATPNLTITFAHSPNVPTNLSTSPNAATIGNGDATLNADVADPDGGSLGVYFDAYITGHQSAPFASTTGSGGTTPQSAGSGSPTSLFLPQGLLNNTLTNTADGGVAGATSMNVTWSIYTMDSSGQTSPTATSTFTYSTAQPGEPGLYLNSGYTTPCSATTVSATVGTALTVYLRPHTGSTTIPTSYTYQLNAAGGQSVAAAPTTGDATVTIVPTSNVNVLTVNAVAAGSNVGEAGTCEFSAADTATAVPGDLTGNGTADLVVPGTGTAGLPAGAWLAPGTSTGQVSANPVNIGLNGNGASATNDSPTTFTGNQIITGLFQGTPGFNDVLAYNPTTQTSDYACAAQLLTDYGDSTPLVPAAAGLNSTDFTLNGGVSTASCDSSVANAGNLASAESNDPNSTPVTSATPATPDLLMVNGSILYLNPSGNATGAYQELGPSYTLDSAGPTGSGWSGWTIEATLVGDLPAMFAVNQSTGAVYYYSPTILADDAFNVLNPTYGGTLTSIPAPTEVATSGYGNSSYAEMQGTTINGVPAIWAVSAIGKVSTYELNPAGNGLIQENGGAVAMDTASHSWPLNDAANGSELTKAVDSTGGLNLTGNSGVTGNSGDLLFKPDATFNGTSGYLIGGGGAINPNADWTVSAWAKPTALGGTVLSQSGTNDPVLILSASSSGVWQVSLNTTATGTAATYTTISGGSERLGLWTQLTATYSKETGILTLYADGIEIAVGTDTTPPTLTTGDLLLGATQSTGGFDYYTGQLAEAQTDNSVAAPLPAAASGSDFVPVTPTRIVDTRSNIGATGPVAANADISLAIAGDTVGTQTIPTSGVTAAAVAITEVNATGTGNITAFPDQTPMPITSTLNYGNAGAITNNAIVPLGADGKIDLDNNGVFAGTVQLIVDITGYYTTNTAATNASTYVPIGTATRVLDTRSGVGAPTAKLAAGGSITLTIAGNTTNGADIPADAAGAVITGVALNLTTTNGSGAGYLIGYADGTTQPNTTSMSYYLATGTYAGMAIIPVGSDGKIVIYNASSNTADVIGDVSGYYTTSTSGQRYYPVGSTRMVDTRQYNPHLGAAGPMPATSSMNLAVPANITAYNPTLVLNVTIANSTTIGDLAIYPGDQSSPPITSAVNWLSSWTIANLNLAYAHGGSVNFYSTATGTVQLIVDTDGYFD